MSNRLPVLAAQISFLNRRLRKANSVAVASAIKSGHALIEAKSLVKHGEWLSWLSVNCDMSDRTARLHMRLAEHESELKGKTATIADLTASAAAELIAKPRPGPQWPMFALATGSVAVGSKRCGDRREYLFVDQSEIAGFLDVTHVTRVEGDDEANVNMDVLRRPVKADAIELVINAIVPNIWPPEVGIEWYEVARENVADILDLAKSSAEAAQ